MLDTREVAARTGLSVSTLRKWRLNGRGPAFYKVGSAVRYNPAVLDAWLNERRATSTSQPIAA